MASISRKTIALKSGESVTIRSARPDDAGDLLAYIRSVAAETPFLVMEADEFDQTPHQERQWIEDHLDSPGKIVLVAVASGQVVGCLSFDNGLRRRIAHQGSFGVSVTNSWRGRGIGTALLQSLLDWAEASPLIEKVGLAVFADNVSAIRLYKRLGFVEEGRLPKQLKLGPGQYADEVLMYRFV